MKRRIPTKLELLQLQKLYRTDKRIGQALGDVPENLVAYWRRKKGIGRSVFPKYSLMEIKELWERFGDDAKAGQELGVTKQAFYRWRKKYKLLEKPAILKLEQLEFKFLDEQRLSRSGKGDQPAQTAIQRIVALHNDGRALPGTAVKLRPDLAVSFQEGRLLLSDRRDGADPRPQRFLDFEALLAAGHFRSGQVILGNAPEVAALAVTASLVFLDARQSNQAEADATIAFEVPPTVRVTLTGSSQLKFSPFDSACCIWESLRDLSRREFALELCGVGIERMLLPDRMALLTYVRLLTGRHVLLSPDQMHLNLLSHYGAADGPVPFSDRSVSFLEEITATVSKLRALHFALGRSEFVRDLGELEKRQPARLRIGPLLGGSIDDLKLIASALGERTLSDDCHLYVLPRSRQVFLEALKRKYVQKIVEAGGHVADAAAQPALTLLADDQFELTTETSGGPNSYLASVPAMLQILINGKVTRRNFEAP